MADVDEAVAEHFLMEESPPPETLREGIRRATLSLSFVPVRARRKCIIVPCPWHAAILQQSAPALLRLQ